MICPQTQCNLYKFDGNKTRSPRINSFSVCAYPYVITEFYVIDVESPHNAVIGRPWIHMMKVVLFKLPSASAVSHSVGDRRHKERPSNVPEHYCYRSEEVRVDGEEREGGLQSRPPSGEKAKTYRFSIAITGWRAHKYSRS